MSAKKCIVLGCFVFSALLVGAAGGEPTSPSVDPCGSLVVYFEYDRSQLTTSSRAPLDQAARCLSAKEASEKLHVECHTDARGTQTYNLAVAERYASSVVRYLVAHGVPRDRIATRSFGEERPVCEEPTEACHARNRRCELRFAATPAD